MMFRFLKNKTNFFMGTATYNPLIRWFLRSCDILPNLWFREFRDLPPNDLRCRVGVSGRILANQVEYLTKGLDLWFYLLANDEVDFDSHIVEIGCGCGRRTHLLRHYAFHGQRYSGRYLGIDVDAQMIDWCKRHFDSERFEFVLSTHRSEAYSSNRENEWYRIPRKDESQSLVFGTSVLTHLLAEQVKNYFSEAARVLEPGRALVMTCKCIDLGSHDFGNTYRHRAGPAFVENPAIPEAAVAYESEFLLREAKTAGFSEVSILHADTDRQHTLIAHK